MDDTQIDAQEFAFQEEMLGIWESGVRFDPNTGEIILSEPKDLNAVHSIGFQITQLGMEIINQKNFIEQLKNKIEIWKARILRSEARIDKAKTLIDAMLPEGDKISRPDMGLSIYRMKSKQTIVDDPEKLPEEYITTKIYKNPNLTAIKLALENGISLPAHIQNNSSVVVKDLS